MIFDLVQDFAAVLDTMPEVHSRRRILSLLDEAIRRDVHFIDRHPTTLFQCLWNSCWWYDCKEAACYFELPNGHQREEETPGGGVTVGVVAASAVEGSQSAPRAAMMLPVSTSRRLNRLSSIARSPFVTQATLGPC